MSTRIGRLAASVFLAAALVLAAAGPAASQATSTLNGRILDQENAVLPGATVVATNQATGVTRTTVSNAEGVYYLPGLEPGRSTSQPTWPVSRRPRGRVSRLA